MKEFTISMAGVPIGVSALHPSTKSFCREYLTAEAPRFSVALSAADAEAERKRLAGSKEGTSGAEVIPASSLEITALHRKLAEALPDYGAVVFHGSALGVEGRAYVFAAPSGTGKTTHARLWLREVPGAYVLNGDKPLFRFAEDGAYVCGSPWQGKENMGRPESLPLEALCILERGEVNHIEAIDFPHALNQLVHQTYRCGDPARYSKTLDLLGRLGKTRLYRMTCNREPEAARVSWEAMRPQTELEPKQKKGFAP